MQPFTLAALLTALPLSLAAQSYGTCGSRFEAPVSPGHEIAMNIRAGDITIAGTDAAVIRVSCTMGNNDRGIRDIRIHFAADHLTIRGGPDREVHIRIEIPHLTNLRVRCTAGDLSVSGISGNQDVQLNAGDLTIAVGDPSAYRRVEASVLAGDLTAPAFGEAHGGLFRSFRKDNPAGRYRLRAELLAGDLILK